MPSASAVPSKIIDTNSYEFEDRTGRDSGQKPVNRSRSHSPRSVEGLKSREASPVGGRRELTAALPTAEAAGIQSRELPPAVWQAQEELRRALTAQDKAAPRDAGVASERTDTALTAYITELSVHLRDLSKAPTGAVTPSLKQWGANATAAFVNNVVSFLIPTLASSFIPERYKEYQKTVYAATLALAPVAGAELASALQRFLGGGNAQLRLSAGGSANVGTYKAIAADMMLAAGNLMLYSGASAAWQSNKHLREMVGGDALRALVSGVVMSVLGQGIISAAGKLTLSRNGVQDAKYLPETAHNRSIPDGIYMTREPARTDRTTGRAKATEVAVRTAGSIAGAGAYWGIRDAAERKIKDAPGENFIAVFFGVGVYLAIAQIARAAFTFLANDPAKHANKFGVIASTVLSQQIRSSALNHYEGLLDITGSAIRAGLVKIDDVDCKPAYERATNVLSGAAFRRWNAEDQSAATAFAHDLRDAATALGAPDTLTDTQQRLAHMLQSAADSIDAASKNVSGDDPRPIGAEIQDAGNRIRDVQSLVLESLYRHDGPDNYAEDNQQIMKLVETMMPTFAALRQRDRLDSGKSFYISLRQYSVETKAEERNKRADQLMSALIPDGHRRVMARDIAAFLESGPARDDVHLVLDSLNEVLARSQGQKMTELVKAKLAILKNQLALQVTPEVDQNAARGRVHAFLTQFQNLAEDDEAGAARIATALQDAFAAGQFSPMAFQLEVAQWQENANIAAGDADEEAGRTPDNDGTHERRALDTMRRALPTAFEAQIHQEFPIVTDQTIGMIAKDMIETLWQDQAAIPAVQRDLMASAMALPQDGSPVEHEIPEQHDAHFHPTSYSGRINSLEMLAAYMLRNGVTKTILAGIPSQVWKPTPEAKYYANSIYDIDYRDHDFPLAEQWKKLPKELQKLFGLSITGFDVTNGPNIQQELKNRMRANKGVFMAVGEVTLKKEIISEKNPQTPEIDSQDTQDLFNACAQAGLPLILHCDRSEPGKKDLYAKQVLGEIGKWAKLSQWHGDDVIAKSGVDAPPPMVPKIVWAHGAGISRFTAESKTHTSQLDTMLKDESLTVQVNGKTKQLLYLDMSWDFIAHDILENVHDQLANANLSKPMRDGIQNLLRLYKAFTEEGGRADKADDLGDRNLASVHRVAGEKIAKKYFDALANFKQIVDTEMAKDGMRERFEALATEHGDDGNNWLYIFSQYQDRLLFGTDALAVGIKAHGDAAYAMNTQVLTPMYHIFDALGSNGNERFKDVSKKVATENYNAVFHDPDVEARRAAYEDMLQRDEPYEHSTNRVPQAYGKPDENLRQRLQAGRQDTTADV